MSRGALPTASFSRKPITVIAGATMTVERSEEDREGERPDDGGEEGDGNQVVADCSSPVRARAAAVGA